MSNKYQNGKVYTIRCLEDPTLIYVGSTIQPLSKRWGGHKIDSKRKEHLLLYQSINNEWDKWYIELYELCPCNCKEELLKREGEIIREIGNLNNQIAGRTKEEWKNENPDYDKEYRLKNADRLKEQKKVYREEHKEELLEKSKEWYFNNLDKIKEYRQKEEVKEKKKESDRKYREEHKEALVEKKKEYYEINAEKIKEKVKQYRIENIEKIKERKKQTIMCECGCEINKEHLNRHLKTKKHNDLISK